MSVLTLGMGAHNVGVPRHWRSQQLGSQSWALTIYTSVLSVGRGAHNVGVPGSYNNLKMQTRELSEVMYASVAGTKMI